MCSDAPPGTAAVSANWASLTQRQQSWSPTQNLWWVLKRLDSMVAAKEQAVHDIDLTTTLTLQERLYISCWPDSHSVQSQRLSPACNRTPAKAPGKSPAQGPQQQLRGGGGGGGADLHPEILDLAQLQIPPQVYGLLQAVVPLLQLEHLCVQLLIQLQQQGEAH